MKKICFVLIVILLFVFSVQSKEHSLEALFFSYATYTKDEKEIREWTCGWCQKISDVTVVDIHSEIGSNTRAIVATTPKFHVVAFRGSENWENWFNNLIAIFTNFPPNVKDSKAHQGFLGTYIFIRQNLLKSILALPRKPIIVTGHSRGAAVATFAALELAAGGLDVQFYSFGSPRVGNLEFSKFFNDVVKQKYRYVNRRDVVTRLPSIVLGYNHVGTEIWIQPPKNESTTCPSSEDGRENLECSHKIPFTELNVGDHSRYFGFSARERLKK